MPGVAVGCVPLNYTFSLQDVANLTGCNDLMSANNNISSLLAHISPGNSGTLRQWSQAYRMLYSGSNGAFTQTVTVLPHTDKRVMVITIGSNVLKTGTAPSIGSSYFTRAGSNQGSYSTEIWYLIDPPVGTYTLTIPRTGNNFYWLYISTFPYVNSVSLYSTNFAVGNARYADLYANAPSGQSSFLVSMIVADASSIAQTIYDNIINWIGFGGTYLGVFDQGGALSSLSNPLTENFDMTDVRNWECSNAVFSIS